MVNKKKKAINLGVSILAMIVVICISVTITVMARPLYYFDIPDFHGISKYSISK